MEPFTNLKALPVAIICIATYCVLAIRVAIVLVLNAQYTVYSIIIINEPFDGFW